MKRKLMLFIILAVALSACGGVKTDMPDTPEAEATAVIVEQYITANLEYDADGLMALYADDLFWMDYGGNDGPLTKGNLDYFIHETMAARDFKYDFNSYLVTPDGRFAVIETVFSMPAASSGKWVSVSCITVLEFMDGKIISEIWYYDGTVFH